MLTDILAVVAGFAVWSALWLGGSPQLLKLFPGALQKDGSVRHAGALVALLAFAALVSVGAGYAVTLISMAPTLPLILGVILLLVGIVVQRQYWKLMPVWYHLLFLVLLVPATIYGARLAG